MTTIFDNLNDDIFSRFCRFYRIMRKQKSPMAKYYPKWDLIPGTFDFPAMHATPVMVHHVLI